MRAYRGFAASCARAFMRFPTGLNRSCALQSTLQVRMRSSVVDVSTRKLYNDSTDKVGVEID